LLVAPAPAAIARLQRLHEAAGNLAEDAPAVLAHPEAARGLEQALVTAMLCCLGDMNAREDRAAVRQHGAIMRRFYQVVEGCGDQPLYIPERCRVVGTSLRTLQACCQEQLGMSPKRYLLLRRMNLFRGTLRKSSAINATVTQIATRYGFWQFGRLAVEYKALFGESPSTTLSRRPLEAVEIGTRSIVDSSGRSRAREGTAACAAGFAQFAYSKPHSLSKLRMTG
jgi:AraC-like DNA-binding protein